MSEAQDPPSDPILGTSVVETKPRGSDPWSDETWGQNALNVTFETVETDVFEFSAEGSVQNEDSPSDVEFSLFRGGVSREPFKQSRGVPAGPPVVTVTVHERLSAVYDDVSEEPSCHLEGSIHVRTSVDVSRHPFCLVMRDLLGHMDVLEDRSEVAKDVSNQVSRSSLHRTDRVLRVSLPSSATHKEVQVARYICSNQLRSVPLLVKSRVQVSGQNSRVGFKIRANPSNLSSLTRIVIMLAVPPHVNGRSGKLSRKGGLWDELKRTVSWTIAEMSPGQALEIQAQFESTEGAGGETGAAGRAPKFPILVRCEYHNLFSSVEVKADFQDALSKPIQMELATSARVLHRKV